MNSKKIKSDTMMKYNGKRGGKKWEKNEDIKTKLTGSRFSNKEIQQQQSRTGIHGKQEPTKSTL